MIPVKKIPPVAWIIGLLIVGYLVYRKYKASASAGATVNGVGGSVTTQDRQPVMVVSNIPSNGYLPGMSLWNVVNPPPPNSTPASS